MADGTAQQCGSREENQGKIRLLPYLPDGRQVHLKILSEI
jgi:hypothetical protein